MFTNLLHIDTDQQAEELILGIKQEKAEHDRLVSVCKAQINAYNDKMMGYDLALQNGTQQALSLLGIYCKERATEKDITETLTKYKLPSGQLVWKKQNKVQTVDKDKLLVWACRYANEYVKIKHESVVEWGELKKVLTAADDHYELVTADGESFKVDGVELTDPSHVETFEVK